MKKIEKASLEAMRALQKIKEQSDISEDVIEDIKKTHQKFIEKREKEETNGIQTTIEKPEKDYSTKSYTPNTSKQNKCKWIWTIGSISIIIIVLFLSQIRHNVLNNRDVSTKYDTISISRVYWNKEIEKEISLDYYLIYPKQIGKYELTDFYNELLVRYFGWKEKKTENIDFNQIIRELLPQNGIVEDIYESSSTEVICNYYADRKWLAVDATVIDCPTIHCIYESSFYYDLERQKILEWDDIFLPEKHDKLRKLIKERFKHEIFNTKLSLKNFDIDIINFYLDQKDSIWYWNFACVDDERELGYAYYPITVTIAEKGLTEYLSYTLPNE